MCLDKSKRVTKPRRTSGYGWKVFRRDRRKLYSLCMDELTERPRKQWLTAAKGITYGDGPLDEGWHVYLRKADAVGTGRIFDAKSIEYRNERVLVRVQYRKAFARGTGDGGWNKNAAIVVADELYIL